MQHEFLDYKKNYKVSGYLLSHIYNLKTLFENDVCKTETYNRDKINYTIGLLINEFNHTKWEEIEQ